MATRFDESDMDILNRCQQVVVKQRRPGCHGNKFDVLTVEDQLLFRLQDESEIFQLLHVRIAGYDTNERKIFELRRPPSWTRDKMVVSVGDQVVSVIRVQWTKLRPILFINDPQERPIYRIKGLGCTATKFQIQTLEKQPIGSIDMMLTWCERDQYCITFPPNLPLEHKIIMIGACIDIDYRYFSGLPLQNLYSFYMT